MKKRFFLACILGILIVSGCTRLDWFQNIFKPDITKGSTGSDPGTTDNCTIEGVITRYVSIECMCCPGYEIRFGDNSIFVPDLGNDSVENAVRKKINSGGLPIAITFNYTESDTLCPDQQQLTCITLR